MSKNSKAKRTEARIQDLERELAKEKKKNSELQQQMTIRLDENQVDSFLNDLTKRIEWSTNKIVDESQQQTIITTTEYKKSDGISSLLKWVMAILFFAMAALILCSLYNIWGKFWSEDWTSRFALIIVGIIGFDCVAIGIETASEKDRNYIISLFSALVALVALVMTLIK